eukprot:TRINITY_DN10335_c0_g3_i1.p1 TRINITY_DN10335_c0_g3~~TRINITY_DN10335_c0_g3_i1.p1  ORF type:complete len:2672 (-),score=656.93 TRINITY_DN10335_c0_g3_i1:244-8259(-)
MRLSILFIASKVCDAIHSPSSTDNHASHDRRGARFKDSLHEGDPQGGGFALSELQNAEQVSSLMVSDVAAGARRHGDNPSLAQQSDVVEMMSAKAASELKEAQAALARANTPEEGKIAEEMMEKARKTATAAVKAKKAQAAHAEAKAAEIQETTGKSKEPTTASSANAATEQSADEMVKEAALHMKKQMLALKKQYNELIQIARTATTDAVKRMSARQLQTLKEKALRMRSKADRLMKKHKQLSAKACAQTKATMPTRDTTVVAPSTQAPTAAHVATMGNFPMPAVPVAPSHDVSKAVLAAQTGTSVVVPPKAAPTAAAEAAVATAWPTQAAVADGAAASYNLLVHVPTLPPMPAGATGQLGFTPLDYSSDPAHSLAQDAQTYRREAIHQHASGQAQSLNTAALVQDEKALKEQMKLKKEELRNAKKELGAAAMQRQETKAKAELQESQTFSKQAAALLSKAHDLQSKAGSLRESAQKKQRKLMVGRMKRLGRRERKQTHRVAAANRRAFAAAERTQVFEQKIDRARRKALRLALSGSLTSGIPSTSRRSLLSAIRAMRHAHRERWSGIAMTALQKTLDVFPEQRTLDVAKAKRHIRAALLEVQNGMKATKHLQRAKRRLQKQRGKLRKLAQTNDQLVKSASFLSAVATKIAVKANQESTTLRTAEERSIAVKEAKLAERVALKVRSLGARLRRLSKRTSVNPTRFSFRHRPLRPARHFRLRNTSASSAEEGHEESQVESSVMQMASKVTKVRRKMEKLSSSVKSLKKHASRNRRKVHAVVKQAIARARSAVRLASPEEASMEMEARVRRANSALESAMASVRSPKAALKKIHRALSVVREAQAHAGHQIPVVQKRVLKTALISVSKAAKKIAQYRALSNRDRHESKRIWMSLLNKNNVMQQVANLTIKKAQQIMRSTNDSDAKGRASRAMTVALKDSSMVSKLLHVAETSTGCQIDGASIVQEAALPCAMKKITSPNKVPPLKVKVPSTSKLKKEIQLRRLRRRITLPHKGTGGTATSQTSPCKMMAAKLGKDETAIKDAMKPGAPLAQADPRTKRALQKAVEQLSAAKNSPNPNASIKRAQATLKRTLGRECMKNSAPLSALAKKVNRLKMPKKNCTPKVPTQAQRAALRKDAEGTEKILQQTKAARRELRRKTKALERQELKATDPVAKAKLQGQVKKLRDKRKRLGKVTKAARKEERKEKAASRSVGANKGGPTPAPRATGGAKVQELLQKEKDLKSRFKNLEKEAKSQPGKVKQLTKVLRRRITRAGGAVKSALAKAAKTPGTPKAVKKALKKAEKLMGKTHASGDPAKAVAAASQVKAALRAAQDSAPKALKHKLAKAIRLEGRASRGAKRMMKPAEEAKNISRLRRRLMNESKKLEKATKKEVKKLKADSKKVAHNVKKATSVKNWEAAKKIAKQETKLVQKAEAADRKAKRCEADINAGVGPCKVPTVTKMPMRPKILRRRLKRLKKKLKKCKKGNSKCAKKFKRLRRRIKLKKKIIKKVKKMPLEIKCKGKMEPKAERLVTKQRVMVEKMRRPKTCAKRIQDYLKRIMKIAKSKTMRCCGKQSGLQKMIKEAERLMKKARKLGSSKDIMDKLKAEVQNQVESVKNAAANVISSAQREDANARDNVKRLKKKIKKMPNGAPKRVLKAELKEAEKAKRSAERSRKGAFKVDLKAGKVLLKLKKAKANSAKQEALAKKQKADEALAKKNAATAATSRLASVKDAISKIRLKALQMRSQLSSPNISEGQRMAMQKEVFNLKMETNKLCAKSTQLKEKVKKQKRANLCPPGFGKGNASAALAHSRSATFATSVPSTSLPAPAAVAAAAATTPASKTASASAATPAGVASPANAAAPAVAAAPPAAPAAPAAPALAASAMGGVPVAASAPGLPGVPMGGMAPFPQALPGAVGPFVNPAEGFSTVGGSIFPEPQIPGFAGMPHSPFFGQQVPQMMATDFHVRNLEAESVARIERHAADIKDKIKTAAENIEMANTPMQKMAAARILGALTMQAETLVRHAQNVSFFKKAKAVRVAERALQEARMAKKCVKAQSVSGIEEDAADIKAKIKTATLNMQMASTPMQKMAAAGMLGPLIAQAEALVKKAQNVTLRKKSKAVRVAQRALREARTARKTVRKDMKKVNRTAHQSGSLKVAIKRGRAEALSLFAKKKADELKRALSRKGNGKGKGKGKGREKVKVLTSQKRELDGEAKKAAEEAVKSVKELKKVKEDKALEEVLARKMRQMRHNAKTPAEKDAVKKLAKRQKEEAKKVKRLEKKLRGDETKTKAKAAIKALEKKVKSNEKEAKADAKKAKKEAEQVQIESTGLKDSKGTGKLKKKLEKEKEKAEEEKVKGIMKDSKQRTEEAAARTVQIAKAKNEMAKSKEMIAKAKEMKKDAKEAAKRGHKAKAKELRKEARASKKQAKLDEKNAADIAKEAAKAKSPQGKEEAREEANRTSVKTMKEFDELDKRADGATSEKQKAAIRRDLAKVTSVVGKQAGASQHEDGPSVEDVRPVQEPTPQPNDKGAVIVSKQQIQDRVNHRAVQASALRARATDAMAKAKADFVAASTPQAKASAQKRYVTAQNMVSKAAELQSKVAGMEETAGQLDETSHATAEASHAANQTHATKAKVVMINPEATINLEDKFREAQRDLAMATSSKDMLQRNDDDM